MLVAVGQVDLAMNSRHKTGTEQQRSVCYKVQLSPVFLFLYTTLNKQHRTNTSIHCEIYLKNVLHH